MTDKTSSVYTRNNIPELRTAVEKIVQETPVTDIHTHLFSPHFGNLLLYGPDELLTYHYLVAETLRASSIPYEQFWAMEKPQQAEFVWNTLFLERSPISEAARGVLTALGKLGIDLSERRLDRIREYFQDVDLNDHVNNVFQVANLKCVVMTNDPFDPTERDYWSDEYQSDERFHAALRIDPLLLNWKVTCGLLKSWGYETDALLSKKTLEEVRRFLVDWLFRTKALYMAVSLPPTFNYPDESPTITLLEQCVLPIARDRGLPFAMMIGVQRSINPSLRLAGDGLGHANVRALERLCVKFPSNRFMVTMLSRENQHELCVVARKFRNLMIFGCWWFLNNPSLIEEMTRMRLELLGLSVVPQHSDARVLEQVIYKWDHSRSIIASVLADKYADLVRTGWTLKEDEIRRDVSRLFGNNFWEFLE